MLILIIIVVILALLIIGACGKGFQQGENIAMQNRLLKEELKRRKIEEAKKANKK